MRIIVCHNYYRDRGGEDQVFEEEVALLRDRGNDVETFVRRNDDFSGLRTLSVAAGTVWNRSSAAALGDAVRAMRADIVHFHNWLPQISQGAFHAARGAGSAVVQTLHNYRFTCAKGVLYRDGHLCEECVGKTVGWPAIVHGCYREQPGCDDPCGRGTRNSPRSPHQRAHARCRDRSVGIREIEAARSRVAIGACACEAELRRTRPGRASGGRGLLRVRRQALGGEGD